MNKLQKLLSVLLAAVLLLSCMPLAALAEDVLDETEEEFVPPDELIVAHPTITKGDFFTEMFGNDTADIDVRALIHGYNLVNWDQNQGTYVFDPSVVRQAQAGWRGEYREYDLVIADNLKYSNGEPITAWDYAFSILLMMSPEIEAIGGKIYRAEHLAGYDDYIAARRKVMAGEALDPAEDIDYLSGVTVLSDYQLRIWLDPEFLPYFFEVGLLMTVPYPIDVIAPGCKVVSGYEDEEGNPVGIKIVNADGSSDNPAYTPELLKKTILDPETGYNTFPSVVSGPYVIKSWDGVTGHFEINPEFKGAWMVNNLPDGALYTAWENARAHGKVVQDINADGTPALDADGNPIELVIPSIEKIAFTVADNDTIIEQIEAGEVHLVNKVTYKETVQKGNASDLQRQPYPRIGLSFLTFTYDWPTVHDIEVRQAIAWCMDRQDLTNKYCATGMGLVMNGYFGLEQWEYLLLTGAISFPISVVQDEHGTPILPLGADEEELEKTRETQKYRWARNEEEREAWEEFVWQPLRDRWKTLLTAYTVDLDKANELLDKAGWTLNRNGEPYQAGVDDVRCKEVDGELVALDLKLMFPEGNHMAEFMLQAPAVPGEEAPEREEVPFEEMVAEPGSFVDNLAQVGIKLTLVPAPMQDLLHSYYRETDRTTDMIYLATNFHVIVDPSITYSTDDTVGHQVWNNTYSDDEALFQYAVDMRKTEPGDIYTYVDKWMTFQERYNQVLPTIPVYSNIYNDYWVDYLQNYVIDAQVTWSQAILLAYFELPSEAEDMMTDDGELGEDEGIFD